MQGRWGEWHCARAFESPDAMMLGCLAAASLSKCPDAAVELSTHVIGGPFRLHMCSVGAADVLQYTVVRKPDVAASCTLHHVRVGITPASAPTWCI